jgi:hypothetical protein
MYGRCVQIQGKWTFFFFGGTGDWTQDLEHDAILHKELEHLWFPVFPSPAEYWGMTVHVKLQLPAFSQNAILYVIL